MEGAGPGSGSGSLKERGNGPRLRGQTLKLVIYLAGLFARP